jgi:type II secretory pathway component PulJ
MTTTHRSQHRRAKRQGFTLSELLLGLTLTVLVFASAVPFFKVQTRAVQADMGRADALLTARFAQNTLDRELRNIGIATEPANAALGIPRNQPRIVQAAEFAVTFNSNLVTNDTGDVAAVHYDPNVPTAMTDALTAGAITLPLSGPTYPDFTYRKSNGALSGAETISMWASADSSTSIPNDLVLFRRVNNGPVVVVTRGIELPAGQPLFRYSRIDTLGAQVPVPSGQLPMYWTNPVSDSIRTVEVTVRSVYHDWNLAGDTTSYLRMVQSKTRLMNMGLVARRTCGDVPLDPGSVVATWSNPLGVPRVTITWSPSIDESAGEKDVERYVIYRDTLLAGFTEPMQLVGKGVVLYEDFVLPAPGTSVRYGVAAQDCSPSEGNIMPAAVITIP